MKTYLVIDVDASSGGHVLGRFDGSRIAMGEVYRFENGASNFWNFTGDSQGGGKVYAPR